MKESFAFEREKIELIAEFGNVRMIPTLQAAGYYGLSKYTVMNSDFPKKRIGGRWYSNLNALAEWSVKNGKG